MATSLSVLNTGLGNQTLSTTSNVGTDFDLQSYVGFGNIGTYTVLSDNPSYPLRLASLSEVEVESRSNVSVFIATQRTSSSESSGLENNDASINFSATSYTIESNEYIRSNDTFMSLRPDNETGIIYMNPQDNTSFSTLKLQYPSLYLGNSLQDQLHVRSKTHFENMASFNQFYSKDLRIFKRTTTDNVMCGYMFQINDSDRLELIKIKKEGENIYSKSVAVFGNGDITSSNSVSNTSLEFEPDLIADVALPTSNSSNTWPTTVIHRTITPSDSNIDLGSSTSPINIIYANHLGTSDVPATSVYSNQVTTTSGADFAERIKKENDEDVFVAGEVVGINSDGKLTKSFSNSVHFGIVSDTGAVIANDGLTEDESEIIAFSGRVKVGIVGGAGEYLIPVSNMDDTISCISKSKSSITLDEYMKCVGHIITHTDDGLSYIIVKH